MSEDYPDLLFDRVSGLPSYLAVMEQLEPILKKNNSLGMLYIDLSHLGKIEETVGTGVYEQIIKSISEIVMSMRGRIIRNKDLICVSEVGSPSPMIFLSETRRDRGDTFLTRQNVEGVAERVQDYVFSKLFYLVYPYIKERPKVSVGYSFVVNNPLIRPRRLIYQLIENSKDIAKLQRSRLEVRNKEKLQRIILEEDIQTMFQPIVDMQSCKVIGYEALSRGPIDSEYETPLMLFALAKETGLLFELDRLCRKKSLQNAANLGDKYKIFVNTLPTTIHDPEFRGNYLAQFLKDLNLKPGNIVFEITEGAAIENYALFREAVEYYTNMGINIAIDDTGTGYSTLESIIEIKPDFLKIDISMVKDVDKSLLKRELLKALLSISNHIDAQVIAEGIETRAEMQTLRDLGVINGQGYLFARPGPAFPTITIPNP